MKVIDNTAQVSLVSYKPEFSAVCSIGEVSFYGVIVIKYRPLQSLLEFVSVDEWIMGLAYKKVTIEEVTRLTFDEVTRVLGDIPLCVTVHARTTVHAPVSAQIIRGEW